MTSGRLLGVVLTTCLFVTPVLAQSKSAPRDQLAVDVVSLKTGRSLRGAVLYRSPKADVSVAVSRSWLKQANPAYYEQAAAADALSQREAWTQTRDRLKLLLELPPEQPRLAFFYRSELERLEELLGKDDPLETLFLVLDLPAASVGRVTLANPERRKLALLAWQEEIPDVETRDANSLKQILVKEGVPLEGPLPDLSDRLPAQPQSEREWEARLAIVEYALGRPLDFQGMGSTIVRTGADQPVDLAAVLPRLLQEQVGSVLDDLLGNARPTGKPVDDRELLKPAIAEAETAGSRGFRLTRLQLNAETSQVMVETCFVARLSPDDWQPVWAAVEHADGRQARPEQEAQIEADPQLQTALKSIKSLGLGVEDSLRQAIRVGAATMAAQQGADGRFFELRERYTRRLDGPRLPVTE